MSQLRRRSVADAFLLELLTRQLDEWRQRTNRGQCRVVDLGGGTGTFASVLADLGYAITVLDPSADALASLQRRTEDRRRRTDHQVGQDVDQDPRTPQIRGLQGDASELVALLGPSSVDVVVCHRVLEVVEDPAEALRGMAEVLRPGGVISLLLTQPRSVVLSQALSGQAELALQTWQDPARLDLEQATDWVTSAGFQIMAIDGVGSVAGHVAEAAIESDVGFYTDLLALERQVSRDPAFRALAPTVHLFAELPTD